VSEFDSQHPFDGFLFRFYLYSLSFFFCSLTLLSAAQDLVLIRRMCVRTPYY